MKNYKKPFLFLTLFLSLSIYSQNLSKKEVTQIQSVQKNYNQYKNKEFKDLLLDLPEIKMIRIMPNNPESGVHTFIIGFVNNAKFSKLPNKERLTVFIKDSIQEKNLFKEDITTNEAIRKYGKLNVDLVIH